MPPLVARSWVSTAVLGFYDFVSIVEAPDNETAAHLSIDLGSRGSVSITTLPAISIVQLRDKLLEEELLSKEEYAASLREQIMFRKNPIVGPPR